MNYHNYHQLYYCDSQGSDCYMHSADNALLIDHFPNPHEPYGSPKSNRVIRAPRVYDTGYISAPQFKIPTITSTGSEPIGYLPEDGKFGTLMTYELTEVVEEINFACLELFELGSWTMLDFFMEILTLTLWKWMKPSIFGSPFNKLDVAVENINLRLQPKGLQLIHPQQSAFLSLDFELLYNLNIRK